MTVLKYPVLETLLGWKFSGALGETVLEALVEIFQTPHVSDNPHAQLQAR